MNHTRTTALVALAATGLLLAGCSSSDPTPAKPADAADPGTGSATVAAGRADATEAFATIAGSVKSAKLSGTVTAENDGNHLLGRPGQYTSKITFTDRRIKSADTQGLEPGDVGYGGSVETFANPDDAATRATYIQAVTKNIPALIEYDFVHGTNVIRVSHFLTPVQAKEYDAAGGTLR
ncbi:hypothetical protein [Streptomyces sp. NBC_00083]|uniref:hypothetical protein n=1 Tax=Streptomyces sp. NBC_00083 TaxID=2975647 RepID=UPI002256F7AD|nr:hypothetical protein [Streptomyces sp. NBC_00083]MCX5386999.1 hypothetical protein [Streptomyces sp. NBC_00083]